MKSARAHVLISGSVHGVGMRSKVSNTAKGLKLGGWVRNLESGEVEAVFEGSEENVRKMVEWCKASHGSAEVIDVNAVFEDYSEGLTDFRIVD
ncbi:MAG: acylphosphatase [Candidatus Aenigmatarchaeota archaeon]